MKKQIRLLLCGWAITPMAAMFPAQETLPVKCSGFVMVENFYDTRQVVSFREDILLLYPKPKVFDAFGNDINDHPMFNMSALRARLRFEAQGPDVHCYDSSAVVEGEFLGPVEVTYGAFRLRHAYGKLQDQHSKFIFGQYWHPILDEPMLPPIISYNMGAPIVLYARVPQMQYSYTVGQFKILAAAVEEAPGFESFGPDTPFESTLYIRRALVPNLHSQLQYVTEDTLFGVGVDYKRLVPRLINTAGNVVDEQLNGVSATVFLKQQWHPCTLRAQLIYAQNAPAYLGFGGYVVTRINPLTDERTYAPLQNVNAWVDINANNQHIVPGIFVGVSKNVGATSHIQSFDSAGNPFVYGRNPNIDYVVRVSPRCAFNINNFQVALECEYTGASYGTINAKGKVSNGSYVQNLRIALDLFYFF